MKLSQMPARTRSNSASSDVSIDVITNGRTESSVPHDVLAEVLAKIAKLETVTSTTAGRDTLMESEITAMRRGRGFGC